jgi:uncharacterized protein DUF4440
MKRCPTCNKTYTDRNLSFCIEDGTPLVPVNTAADETTVVSPSSGDSASHLPPTVPAPSDWQGPVYQPPRSYVPPGSGQKRKIWPWVVGIVGVLIIGLIGLGVFAAILIPRIIREAENRNSRVENVNANDESSAEADRETNLNANSNNANENTGSNDEAGSPPSDPDQVLADLTDLENEWTVANINADKKKLERILADDYVGTSADGSKQTKAEYINTIQRDTSIKHWDFEDLKVNLNGDRASLTGVIRLVVGDNQLAYRFTDKFVWREGRWQAISSSVSPIK